MGLLDFQSFLLGTSPFQWLCDFCVQSPHRGIVGSLWHVCVGARRWWLFCCGFRQRGGSPSAMVPTLHGSTFPFLFGDMGQLVFSGSSCVVRVSFLFCRRWLCRIMTMLFPPCSFCVLWLCFHFEFCISDVISSHFEFVFDLPDILVVFWFLGLFFLCGVGVGLNATGYRFSINQKTLLIVEVFSKQALCMLKYWCAE